MAENAKTLASSAARSRLLRAADPKFPEALMSTSKKIVSSRSSVNFLTKGRPARAVTFQSMVRTGETVVDHTAGANLQSPHPAQEGPVRLAGIRGRLQGTGSVLKILSIT